MAFNILTQNLTQAQQNLQMTLSKLSRVLKSFAWINDDYLVSSLEIGI
jgi:hypothetical protein